MVAQQRGFFAAERFRDIAAFVLREDDAFAFENDVVLEMMSDDKRVRQWAWGDVTS